MSRLNLATTFVLLLYVAGAATVHGARAAENPIDVRVGIIASEGEFERWREVLQSFEKAADPPLRFHLAVGAFAELLHWMEEGWIDVAVLSPALFAMSRDVRVYPRAAADFEYLVTVGYPPPTSKLARNPQPGEGYQFHYRSVCVVPEQSRLRTIEDIVAANEKGELIYVFGHPLSTSGRIAPAWALRKIDIVPDPSRIEYVHSHTNALRTIAQGDADVERVAFVFDRALESNNELAPAVRVIDFPELDAMELPWDVVVCRQGRAYLETLRQLLLDYHGRFRRLEDWQRRYGSIRRWADEIGLIWDQEGLLPMSLEGIGSYLEHSWRTQPEPPRLAVVLSGGGARCSYQVGAVAAIEEELRRLNERNPNNRFDIDLVVGTSGGAINALPVALGLTADPAGMADFESVWTGLDQRKIIQLSPMLRVSIGLWLGILRITILVILLKIIVRRRSVRAWWLGGILVASSLLEAILHLRLRVPWSWLGDDHTRQHAWLWFGQGHNASVILLFAAGIVILAVQAVMRSRGSSLRVSPPTIGAWSLFALVTLPLASGFHLLIGEDTLSRGKGMEQAMADGMSLMIGQHARRVTGEPIEFSTRTPMERLRELSRSIHDRSLLQRDLVITGTCLEQSRALLPDDLYFYMRALPSADPSPLGPRGVPLADFPNRLLEVVLGSGSIFPLFPARTLSDFPVEGESVELIDGGFAHNSPIEAAVLWGATHVILIEASPERSGKGTGLAANIIAAAEYYARQTEQVDRRSSKEVVVFTLSPEEPHPCLLDFSSNLIRATIDKGYQDARGLRADDPDAVASRRFVKQPGKPVFVAVSR